MSRRLRLKRAKRKDLSILYLLYNLTIYNLHLRVIIRI